MELNYKKYGDSGPALIILHGLLGSLDNWHSLATKFGEDYTVYTIDQRNHGKSPHSSKMSYTLMADDLYEFMQTHQLLKANIIGHSMGGKTAMQFAIHFPHLIDKLIVVDMSPRPSGAHHNTIFEALFSIDITKIRSRQEADQQLAGYIPEFAVRQFLLKNLGRDEKGNFKWKMNLKGIYDNYRHILKGIEPNAVFDKQTLFIKGGKSGYVQTEDEELIRKIFPASSIKTIEDAGHWVHAEAPEAFYMVAREFLQN